MKTVFLATLLLCSVATISAQNYLLEALDSAMAMKANFDSNAEYYRSYLNYESESLSRNLIESVAQALETATTSAQGAAIESCALMAAYYSVSPAATVIENIDILEEEARVFYRIINEELMRWNVFETPFDVFYYQFTTRLEEAYTRLNDVLLQNTLDSLVDFMDASRFIFNNMNDCVAAVGK